MIFCISIGLLPLTGTIEKIVEALARAMVEAKSTEVENFMVTVWGVVVVKEFCFVAKVL